MPKIQKATSGKYEFWLDLGRDPATGKRRQVHRAGFNTKKEAEAEIRRLQNEADKGVFIKKQLAASTTFADFAPMWLDNYAGMSGAKRSTINTKSVNIKTLNKHIGNVKLKDINKHRYEAILIELDREYAQSTLNGLHITAGQVLQYAVECDLLAANPARVAKKPKKAKTLEEIQEDIEENYLSKDDLNMLLDVIKRHGDLQYYALFRLLAFSGMRIGEALALETSKIDFSKSVIKVRQTCCNETNRIKDYYLQTPKTDSSVRDIDMDVETMSLLHLWINEQRKNKMFKRDIWHNEHDFIFTAKTCPGYPMLYSTASKMFKRYLKHSGLDDSRTPHILRHTHASLLAESGATLEQIQERLGHADDEITRLIYLHVTKTSKANMINQFAAYMQV